MDEIGVWRRHRLKLDEPSEPLDIVEVDTNIAPKKQPPTLGDHNTYPDGGGKRGTEHRSVLDLDDPVAALALLRLACALKLDEVRSARMLFAELQTIVGHFKVSVLLPDLAVILGPKLSAYFKRAAWVGIARLQLNISPRSLFLIDRDELLAISLTAARAPSREVSVRRVRKGWR